MAVLPGALFKKANLSTASLYLADLAEAEMKEATAINTNFRRANLEGADLEKAELRCAKFSRAGLIKANLENAYLEGAVFYKADMNEANLENAHIGPFNCKDEKYIASFIKKCSRYQKESSSKSLPSGEPLSSDACTENASEGKVEPTSLKNGSIEICQFYRCGP